MSVQAITWALGKAPNMAMQAVLFSLSNHADEWGITYVGQDTIAAECVCRRATVTTNVARLEEEGLLARIRRHDAKGRRTSDLIVLAPCAADRGTMRDADKRAVSMYPPEVCALARLGTGGAPRPADQGTFDERLGTPDVSLGTRGVHEPSEEPSVEPSEKQRLVAQVWDHFQQTIPAGRRYKLDHARRLVIVNALKVRSVEECCRAIDGLAVSDYHVGMRYLDIKYALKGGGRDPRPDATIDRMMAMADGQANGNGNGHAQSIFADKVWPDGRYWDDLTKPEQANARDAVAMGLRPWEPREEAVVASSNGHGSISASNWLDDS